MTLIRTNGRGAEVAPPPVDRFMGTLQLFRGLRDLWNHLDEATSEVERYNRGHPICIAKCGLCCQRTVPVVSQLEVAYIVGQLPNLPQAQEVQRRALEWLKTPRPELQGQAVPRGAAILERGPCPFLGAEMECLIHSIRPLACRAYGATMPQDVWCPRPLIGAERANARHLVTKETPLGLRIAGILGGIWKAMKHFGREDLAEVGFLPTLIAEALSPKEVHQLHEAGQIHDAKMTKERWVKPDLFGALRYGL